MKKSTKDNLYLTIKFTTGLLVTFLIYIVYLYFSNDTIERMIDHLLGIG
jgi:hypothetical protein